MGMILSGVLDLVRLPVVEVLKPVVPLEPVVTLEPVVDDSETGRRARGDTLSTVESLTGPLMAAVGPGKSSGTMGLPRTLDSLDGGVVTKRTGVEAGLGDVAGALVAAAISSGSFPKSVW